jgi:hypothetical protein
MLVYECVIIQFVLVFTSHLYTYYSLDFYFCFYSLQEVTLVSSKCARQF